MSSPSPSPSPTSNLSINSNITLGFNGTYFTVGFTSYTPPITIANTTGSQVTVSFAFTAPLTDSSSHYIICGSSNLTFDGTNSIPIDITAQNYLGLVQNGTESGIYDGVDGYGNIILQNIVINSVNGTLQPFDGNTNSGAGWIGQQNFVGPSTAISCSSNGPISKSSGGIFGSYSANCTAEYCSSSGSIDSYGGGIFGSNPYHDNAEYCYSLGSIGDSAGGIFGDTAYNACVATLCYSRGAIFNASAGGIFGTNAGVVGGYTCSANNCYNSGTIGSPSGQCGIFGSLSSDSETISTNCYALTGLISSGPTTNCYAENGSWEDGNASQYLLYGISAPPTYVSLDGPNTPYYLSPAPRMPYILNFFPSPSPSPISAVEVLYYPSHNFAPHSKWTVAKIVWFIVIIVFGVAVIFLIRSTIRSTISGK